MTRAVDRECLFQEGPQREHFIEEVTWDLTILERVIDLDMEASSSLGLG